MALASDMDWSSVKFVFYDTATNAKNNLCTLLKFIEQSEKFLNETDINENKFHFYFVTLAANYIGHHCTLFEKNELSTVSNGCKILLRCLLTYMLQVKTSENWDNYSSHLNLALAAISALCSGKQLSASEFVSVVAFIKEWPSNAPVSGEKEKESKKPLIYSSFAEQMIKPLDRSKIRLNDSLKKDEKDFKKLLIEKNISSLQEMGANNIIFKTCTKLPVLKRYITEIKSNSAEEKNIKYSTEMIGAKFSYRYVLLDITFVENALALPIFEPLTIVCLQQLTSIMAACLRLALFVQGIHCNNATSTDSINIEDDVMWNQAVQTIEKTVVIIQTVSDTLKKFSYSAHQNYYMIVVWVLINGLQNITLKNYEQNLIKDDKITKVKGKDAVKSSVKNSFSVLSVALANEMLNMIVDLLENAKKESTSDQLMKLIDIDLEINPAPLDICAKTRACDRLLRIFKTVPLVKFLYQLAAISHRKVMCLILNKNKNKNNANDVTSLESIDMFLETSESGAPEEGDEDNESLFGAWFEEVLTLGDQQIENISSKTQTSDYGDLDNTFLDPLNFSVVPETDDPEGYLALIIRIFNLLDIYFVNTECKYVSSYLSNTIQTDHLTVLAKLIGEVDWAPVNNDLSCVIDSHQNVSSSIGIFTHNLIARDYLSVEEQDEFLVLMGIKIPPLDDVDKKWPLQIYPRTLAILAQILLKKPMSERDELSMYIWQNMINTLNTIIEYPPNSNEESEDLNIEHAQLLIFLFNSMSLTHKKGILLAICNTIIGAKSYLLSNPINNNRILALSRLLLLFDYLVRRLYDVPEYLLSQVEWNLMRIKNELKLDGDEVQMPDKNTYMLYNSIEDNFRKRPDSVGCSVAVIPCFYKLLDDKPAVNDAPKLDGLALNFILNHPEKLSYPQLIQALLDITTTLNMCNGLCVDDSMNENKAEYCSNPLTLCSIEYCFNLTWKLLLSLPVPVQKLQDMIEDKPNNYDTSSLLYFLIWGPRANSKIYHHFLKEGINKQISVLENSENSKDSLSSKELLSGVAYKAATMKYDYQIAKSHFNQQLCQTDTTKKNRFPMLLDMVLFDAVISRLYLQTRLGKLSDKDISKSSNIELIQTLMPYCIELSTLIFTNIKTNLLYQIYKLNLPQKFSPADFKNLKIILSMTYNHSSLETSPITNNISSLLFEIIPPWLVSILTKWNSISIGPQIKISSLDTSPENIMQNIIKHHSSFVSSQSIYFNTPSLKRLLNTLVLFTTENIQHCTDFKLRSDFANFLSSMTIDCSSEYLLEHIIPTLEKLKNTGEHDPATMISFLITKNIRKLAYQYKRDDTTHTDHLVEKVLIHSLFWIEQLIFDFSSARFAVLRTFCVSAHKEEISMRKFISSGVFVKALVRLTNRLFSNLKTSSHQDIKMMCRTIIELSTDPKNRLDLWLQRIIVGWNKDKDLIDAVSVLSRELSLFLNDKHSNSAKHVSNNISYMTDPNENFELIKNMIDYIASLDNNDELKTKASLCFLDTLIPIVTYTLAFENGDGFSKMFAQMVRLADYGGPTGHVKLFKASVKLLDTIKNWLNSNGVNLQLIEHPNKYPPVVIASSCLMNYISDVIAALQNNDVENSVSPPSLDSMSLSYYDGMELDGFLPSNDGESDALNEDSDEDSLYYRLCTFTVTQKEFMNQHWYHCHTCKMIEGVGVCSICAKVCHRGHDVTYAKFGNFFCDCGAKENNFCQALTKRNPNSMLDANSQRDKTTSNEGGNAAVADQEKVDSSNSSSTQDNNQDPRTMSTRSLDYESVVLNSLPVACKNVLMSTLLDHSQIIEPTLELCNLFMSSVIKSGEKNSAIGCNTRALETLNDLQELEKTIEVSDNLMLPTMGSQEGAFENVKMNFSGDQGQTIRQLLSAHMVRRVAMCCLSSLHGKRQHLVAVSHDKGRIAVLQMSSLLKQSDISKRKLTLTRLSSVSIPFTVLSVTANPVNEDFLSVCGLKDCHILTFNTCGTVNEHIVLHPSLEVGNFIIRSIWLPGSQTSLALVSAEFVKIYDLSKDVLSPQYYFLVPTGKIRDVTFMCTEERSTMILISSGGYIYTQDMDSSSSAVHGPFYVTNTIDIVHPDISDVNGQVCGGGVSVYYSHTLSLLMFSYVTPGRTFIAPLDEERYQGGVITLHPVFAINSQTSSPTAKNKSNISQSSSTVPPTQPMWQWSEVPGHPGLVCAILQSSNTPVVFMITPKVISLQEIKLAQTKTKITDMVAVRHPLSNGDYRTTLIILCEDGSLRMFLAAKEQTDFWLSPSIQPSCHITSCKLKKKTVNKSGRTTGNSSSFPIDFFEYCVAMNEVEFGGNDMLQIYNPQQIKNRLNSNGMYLVSTKPRFSIEINNNDATMAIAGIRINVGSQDIGRVPGYIDVLGRTLQIAPITRSRWFDFPLTREEILQSDKKLVIVFGPSRDPEGVTMVDSIKVYGKTKESFGWPDEVDEISNGKMYGSTSTSTVVTTNQFNPQEKELPLTGFTINYLDKFIIGLLSILENSFSVSNNSSNNEVEQYSSNKTKAVNIALKLLNHSTQACIQLHSKSLVAVLQPDFHTFKDQSMLSYVLQTLYKIEFGDPKNMDAEAYYRLVLITRGITVWRPQNLSNFVLTPDEELNFDVEELVHYCHPLIEKLISVFWCLYNNRPKNPSYCTIYVPGLKHTEAVVYALVEILHSVLFYEYSGFQHSQFNAISEHYLDFLLCKDVAVSYTAKMALSRALKPHVFGKNKQNIVHGVDNSYKETVEVKEPANKEPENEEQVPQESPEENIQYEVDEPIILLDPRVEPQDQDRQNMEVLIGNVQFPGLIIPPDADDEAMVELAIALSLQDNDGMGNNAELQNIRQDFVELQGLNAPAELQNLQEMSSQNNDNGQNSEALSTQQGHLSDTTASAAGSDDEDTNAVPGSSNLRTSPTEINQAERGELDVEIVYDQNLETNNHLHNLRLSLLEKFINHIPNLHSIGGTRAIPFFQVVSSIVTDMDLNNERDKECFTELMQMFITYIHREIIDDSNLHIRNKQREIVIIITRFIGVLLARPKSSSKSSSDHTTYISQTAASMLKNAQFIDCCLKALKTLQEYWAGFSDNDDNGATVVSVLLEPSGPPQVPDMSPFFLKPYSVSQTKDIFHNYPIILTEMLLRLPYQIQKSWTQLSFEPEWLSVLCEFMSLKTISPFIKRQVRKLLLFVCGNKDKYRQIRDMHALSTSMKNFQQKCFVNDRVPQSSINLTYDKLVEIVEDIKICVDIASSRMLNWQLYCRRDYTVLLNLMRAACLLDEGVSSTILHLLQYAICGAKNQSGTPSAKESKSKVSKVAEDIENAMFEEAQCMILVKEMNKRLNNDILTRFVKTFLLETNSTHIRWQAHALILSIYRNSEHDYQEKLLELLWALWPQLPSYGRKASQFVDLLGYFSFKYNQKAATSTKYVEQAVELLRTQNYKLACHPNANLYTQISQYVDLEGFYLESEPCMVCNNPEIPFSNIKLTSIKVDSKFTTTTQIVKLMGSHTINKIVLRITDLKRTKMVRTMNIFYNNRYVQAVVELKNKPAMWHKAKEITLTSGQTEVKVEFAVPIVACNLLIEYASFYENLHASSETLQCPRCSATVPANPGVCSNCGENVFQCHKCRAINYDEKDPFLCHSCGFCKYAKFDYVLTAKPCCAVDPIENDDDRNKTYIAINSNLEKADRLYKQLVSSKPVLENMLVKVMENRLEKSSNTNAEESQSPNVVPVTGFAAVVNGAMNNNISSGPVHQVNRSIQLLAQKYGSECRNTFEDLSRIVQKVLASRKELIAYDQKQLGQAKSTSRFNGSVSSLTVSDSVTITQNIPSACALPNTSCYGCITAALEHCFVMLRALATNMSLRKILLQQGLILELVENNIRRGSVQTQEEVRNLLCILIQDNQKATEDLCGLLSQRIALTIRGPIANADLAFAVRPEISLLATMLYKEDSCWEQKSKCVMQLFFMTCKEFQSSAIVTYITLPCLKMMRNIIKPPAPTIKVNKDKSTEHLATVQMSDHLMVDFRKWAKQIPEHMFIAWRQRLLKKLPNAPVKKSTSKSEIRQHYLASKYYKKWRLYSFRDIAKPIKLSEYPWLKHFLFCSSTRLLRHVACAIFEGIAQVPERKKEILDLLTRFLSELGSTGENCAEFLTLYQNLIHQTPWKQYLALRGVLIMISDIITKEIHYLHHLEETTLTSNLAQGFVLKSLTGLLASFLEVESIKQQYKGRLVGAILNGYLSLRRLVVQRTRLIDETQSQLLDLLEEMTCGTEAESKAFMAICVETIEKCDPQDVRTPVFVFERLCSIIYPEENDVGEFYMNLDKDPQQEDFLQGRMLGNPYSSSETGLGPLMRDVKNKICQDCELVALLEDDNGMELLVNNKIISLDLPVKEVYKKIWLPEGGDNEAAMHIVYRMRGLLGDATEEFIETLDAKSDQEVNNEEVYKMANVMAECRGLEVILSRLSTIEDLSRSRPLLQVLLKLLGLCVKVKHNQEVLTDPKLGSIPTLLSTLELCLSNEADGLSNTALTEQTLDILETILSKATSQNPEKFTQLSETFGPDDHIRYLLHCASNARYTIVQHLTRVLAALTYNNKAKMVILMDHFASVISDFEKFDDVHSDQDEQMMNLFCDLTYGIENNSLGNTLKDYILSLGVINNVTQYISRHAPTVKSTLNKNSDKDEWKEFISKPSLKYILRFWTGLANGHEPTQTAVSDECIHTVHCLEQVSSDEHVGSLAENLLEALKTNPKMAEKIEQVREQTKAEKKRLAMAMRQKQLGQLGMRTNEKGQVTAETSLLQQVEDLGEETGLVCVICREGYKFQPTKVLGIYTFTKRCVIEEHEVKARKTIGYSTVTHFNVVHFDCHMSAVRLARVRDEWESAALQNANTKCNGLLPMWGPSVAESAYANCLARHNSYLQEATGQRDISYMQTVHDLKLLLLRFAQEKSFHEDTGGGGPQSNMNLVPYLMHMSLYVINTTRRASAEERNLLTYLESKHSDRLIDNLYDTEGPLYWLTMAIMLTPYSKWTSTHHLMHLNKVILMAHVYHTNSSIAPNVRSVPMTPHDYVAYKPALMFFALINTMYEYYFKSIEVTENSSWSVSLADYIRHNDETLLKSSEKMMATFSEDFLPCTSFEEFCDVARINIADPSTYIQTILSTYIHL